MQLLIVEGVESHLFFSISIPLDGESAQKLLLCDEELSTVSLKEQVLGVVVGCEIDGLCEVHPRILLCLYHLLHFDLILFHQLLYLHVKSLNGVIVLLPRITDQFTMLFIVQVESEIGAEKLAFVQDLVADHQFPEFVR